MGPQYGAITDIADFINGGSSVVIMASLVMEEVVWPVISTERKRAERSLYFN